MENSKTIIVTGASRGIGLAIARRLLSKSHNVVAVARNVELLDRLASLDPQRVRVLACDLGEDGMAAQAVKLAVAEFGRLDGLVVNHGIMANVARVGECRVQDWRDIFNVNFFSAVALTQAALPALRASKGSIVYTSSGASTGAYDAWGAYTASKAALNTLARQVACEEKDVTAFAIRPGVVDTDMQRDVRGVHAASMSTKDNAKFRSAYENKTLLKPEQPGNVMADLVLQPLASHNGQYLSWDSPELEQYRKGS